MARSDNADNASGNIGGNTLGYCIWSPFLTEKYFSHNIYSHNIYDAAIEPVVGDNCDDHEDDSIDLDNDPEDGWFEKIE